MQKTKGVNEIVFTITKFENRDGGTCEAYFGITVDFLHFFLLCDRITETYEQDKIVSAA